MEAGGRGKVGHTAWNEDKDVDGNVGGDGDGVLVSLWGASELRVLFRAAEGGPQHRETELAPVSVSASGPPVPVIEAASARIAEAVGAAARAADAAGAARDRLLKEVQRAKDLAAKVQCDPAASNEIPVALLLFAEIMG